MRRRWALSLLDAALSRVDQSLLPRLSRRLADLRARAARRRVRPLTLLLVGLLVAAAAVAVATLVRPEPGGSTGGSPMWVGVHDGDWIPDYIELSRSRLDALVAAEPDRVVYALVSLVGYRTPSDVAALLAAAPDLSSVRAYARVPLAGRQTERVALSAVRLPADLVAAMTAVADRKELDAAAYTDLAADEPSTTLREIYAANAESSRREATEYRRSCACLFALVVRGPVTALAGLASAPDVRAVDPAPELTDAARAVFEPPLPEQVDWATPPAGEEPPTTGPSASG